MALEQVEVTGDEPIDHEDAKRHSRVIAGGDDEYLTLLISAARELCEHETNRALIRATYKQTFAGFPACGPLVLDRPPLVSVTSIEYVGTDGQVATVATDDYEVSAVGDPGRISLAHGKSWPSVLSTAAEPVTVTFVAGYDEAPHRIKQAIRLLVSHWYEHREAVTERTMATLPMAVVSLLNATTWETYR
ncbi:MAG: head-tail connector protein [Planctomycetota bacterium]